MAQGHRDPEPVLLEAGTRFEGLLSFRGAVRVEGLVIGTVVAWGRLVIGKQGHLQGRIEADEVVLEGACEGEVRARVRVELRPGATVSGRIVAPRIAVLDGSLFDGEWHVGAEPSGPEPLLDPDPPPRRMHSEAALSA